MSDGRPGAYPNFRQQLLRFILRQPASDHRFRRSSEQCFFLLQRHVCPPNFYDGRFPYPRVALDNEREALGPVVAIAGKEPDAGGAASGQQAKAVVFYFMNPGGAARWPLDRARQARLDEIGEGTQTPQHVPYMEHAAARVESGAN